MFLSKTISENKLFTKINNNYKRKNILNTTFNYIEICIKNEKNEDIIMTDLFQISLYIN